MTGILVEDPLKMTNIAAPATVVPALMFFDPSDLKLKIGTTGAPSPISSLTGTIASLTGSIASLGGGVAWDWVVTR